ncbi:GBF1 [Cordylochernes scorpioides]|uniref:GBF1 n=1 Tax=Cordylochernes scorpioides TaxID=51811 RepID=A0ABY6LE61_9ARAC|nr:GBF1 [Cordylochernes scorpioides]
MVMGLINGDQACVAQVVQCLRMLLLLKGPVLLGVGRQVSTALHELVRTGTIHSTQDWTVVFTLLECAGAGARPPKVLSGSRSPDSGAQSDSESGARHPDSGISSDRSYASDSEVYEPSGPPGPPSPLRSAPENTAGWIVVSVNKEGEIETVRMRPFPANQFNIVYTRELLPHDPQAFLKSCETLSFLVRDAAHLTVDNFESCVYCIRTFVEASINCGQTGVAGIARLCCDVRRAVRTSALTFLQRALLVPDLQVLTPAEWEACFNKVLFPLLAQLLGPVCPSDPAGMEETRVRAAALLSKVRTVYPEIMIIMVGRRMRLLLLVVEDVVLCQVFLQHLTPLLSLPTFTALWLTILDFMDKYMHHGPTTDLLGEAIPESLKNMLLVMGTAGVFQPDSGPLWQVTWDRIDSFLPALREDIIKPQQPASQPEPTSPPLPEAWTNSWISSDIPNKNLITSPNVKIPGFSLPRREWVLLNRFRTGQGRCAELMKLWGYTKDPNCACNVPQSMSHILDDCPLYKFNGGISNLHSVTPEALNWLKALPLRL